jgi:hypothetical protein
MLVMFEVAGGILIAAVVILAAAVAREKWLNRPSQRGRMMI